MISTSKKKKVLAKYTKLWNGVKYEIETINGGKPGEYGKGFKKIKFESDDSLPLNKTLKIHNRTIILRSVFEEDGKCYLQVFFDECLYELQKCCNRFDRFDASKWIDINKTNASKECIFGIIGILKMLVINFRHMFVMVVMLYQWWLMNWKTLQH